MYKNTKKKEHFRQNVQQVKIFLYVCEFDIAQGQKEGLEPGMNERGG